MKTSFSIFTFLLFISVAIQSQTLAWAKQLGGSSNDEGYGVAVDATGNVYNTGYFKGIADLDPGVGTFSVSSLGDEDIYITKLDASGNFVWAKQIGGSGFDIGLNIKVDAVGNIYIGGLIQGIVDLDPGPGTYTVNGIGWRDFFILKLDASGNFLWAKSFGGIGTDECYSLINDALGNIYISGYFDAIVDFDPGVGVFNLTPNGVYDGFILKLDPSGNFVWVKQIGGTSSDWCGSMDFDPSGNVLISGDFGGTVDFDPGVSTYNVTSMSSNYNGYLLKLDPLGNFIWVRITGGSGTTETTPASISVDPSGNIYTTGLFNATVDFDPGVGTYTLSTGSIFSAYDAYIQKLDVNGNFIWAKQVGSANQEIGHCIKTDATGSVYIHGEFGSTTDFDPGPATYTLAASGPDVFILKLNATGNFVWATQLGGGYPGWDNSLTLDPSGSVYTTGYFGGTIDFDPFPTSYSLTPYGGSDAFIQKLQPGALSSESFFKESLNIKIFPNPNDGKFSIRNPLEKADLIISNTIGQIVFKDKVSIGKIDIQLENIPKGIYFIELHDETKVYREKIIIN